jgi:hypothetical protein
VVSVQFCRGGCSGERDVPDATAVTAGTRSSEAAKEDKKRRAELFRFNHFGKERCQVQWHTYSKWKSFLCNHVFYETAPRGMNLHVQHGRGDILDAHVLVSTVEELFVVNE